MGMGALRYIGEYFTLNSTLYFFTDQKTQLNFLIMTMSFSEVY